tara:strand:- start:1414 stop:1680 length:267 start_codon:yes stop_codon:yes gene_type:complete
MSWKSELKKEAWDNLNVEMDREPNSKKVFDRKTVSTNTQGTAVGQFKELTEDILQLAAKARKEASNQRHILGVIRGKIQTAGIPAVKE